MCISKKLIPHRNETLNSSHNNFLSFLCSSIVVSNFAGEKIEKAPSQGDGNFLLRSTAAVVSLTVCIEGDSTKIPKIKNRIELREALSKVASDAQVDECLLSAEVLWTPEDKLDTLSTEELIADYPSLYPLLD